MGAALAAAEEAVRIARLVADPRTVGGALAVLSEVYLTGGDATRALAIANEGRSYVQGARLSDTESRLECAAASVLLSQGASVEATVCVERAHGMLEKTGAVYALAHVELLRSRIVRDAVRAESVARGAESRGERPLAVHAWTVAAALRAADGHPIEAGADRERAVALAESIGAAGLLARSRG